MSLFPIWVNFCHNLGSKFFRFSFFNLNFCVLLPFMFLSFQTFKFSGLVKMIVFEFCHNLSPPGLPPGSWGASWRAWAWKPSARGLSGRRWTWPSWGRWTNNSFGRINIDQMGQRIKLVWAAAQLADETWKMKTTTFSRPLQMKSNRQQ